MNIIIVKVYLFSLTIKLKWLNHRNCFCALGLNLLKTYRMVLELNQDNIRTTLWTEKILWFEFTALFRSLTWREKTRGKFKTQRCFQSIESFLHCLSSIRIVFWGILNLPDSHRFYGCWNSFWIWTNPFNCFTRKGILCI